MNAIAPSQSISHRLLTSVTRAAWPVFLLALPITSFPYFPKTFGGAALVRPLSVYPLLLLLVLVTLPRIFRQKVPLTLYTILPFVIVAVGSSLVSTLSGIEPALNISVEARIIRGLITLGLGVGIYYTVALFPRSEEELRSALRWLYAGFAIALLWGSLQAVYILDFDRNYFQTLLKWQSFISTRRLFTTRISGMTYEPNWFAEQITFLYMPWLFSALLSGNSVFRLRWRWLTIEAVLLVWSGVVLLFTLSRAGFANLFVLALTAFLFLRPEKHAIPRYKLLLRKLLEGGAIAVLLVGAIYLAGRQNDFFARLWNYWSEVKNTSLSGYLEYIGFGARMTYSEAAYRTFENDPLLGVGVGNYAFYFTTMLPDRPLPPSPELLRLVNPAEGRNRLITPKNFYYRVLAETGMVGAAAFVAFLVALFGCALFLWHSPHAHQKFWGRAALLGVVAFASAAFSFDSFSIPNMWVVFGLITAAASVFAGPDIPHNHPEVNL